MSPPPSARGAGRRDPEPSEPLGSGPRVKTCSSSCLSWLHPLRSWSLRQTRGGSVAGWGLHPLESAAFPRRTPKAAVPTAPVFDPGSVDRRNRVQLVEEGDCCRLARALPISVERKERVRVGRRLTLTARAIRAPWYQDLQST